MEGLAAEALADLRADEVEEETELEQAAHDEEGDVAVAEVIDVSEGHDKAAGGDEGPPPAAQAKEAEDADDEQRADAEDAVFGRAGAEDSAQSGEGVEHGDQQKKHTDGGHAGENVAGDDGWWWAFWGVRIHGLF